MAAYYNENEPYCVEWLRNLIREGLITDGEVDDRNIQDVAPADLRGFDRCHFFAGIAGWDYALNLAGWTSGSVWTGSCPCQPFSAAGKRVGAADDQHLWPIWFNLIRECKPDTVFGEQVGAAIAFGWLDAVSTDLEREGYATGTAILGAHSVGAPHIRQRLWFVADTDSSGFVKRRGAGSMETQDTSAECSRQGQSPSNWLTEPNVGRVADGVPCRVGRLRALGNAIVPQVAAEFIAAYIESVAKPPRRCAAPSVFNP